MGTQKQRYRYEKCLSEEFCEFLESKEGPWGDVNIKLEFNYVRGRTDIVALSSDGEIISFELKLNKWKKALDQAYRNTSFSNRSYVVLPECQIKNAKKHIGEFEKRSVGLCCVGKDGIVVAYPSKHQDPIQEWLLDDARNEILKSCEIR